MGSSSLLHLRFGILMAPDTKVFAMAVAALDRVRPRRDRVVEGEVARMYDGLDRVASLVAVDAEGLRVAGLAGHRVDAGDRRMHLRPRNVVIFGFER